MRFQAVISSRLPSRVQLDSSLAPGVDSLDLASDAFRNFRLFWSLECRRASSNESSRLILLDESDISYSNEFSQQNLSMIVPAGRLRPDENCELRLKIVAFPPSTTTFHSLGANISHEVLSEEFRTQFRTLPRVIPLPFEPTLTISPSSGIAVITLFSLSLHFPLSMDVPVGGDVEYVFWSRLKRFSFAPVRLIFVNTSFRISLVDFSSLSSFFPPPLMY